MTKHLTPLEVCIYMIGPEPELGRICELNPTSPYSWRTARRWRDGGDLPSSRIQRRLLAHAKAKGIPLNPEWLIWGASSAQVEEAMRAAQCHRSAA
jgi:hypothetical protein